jgi:hypothetical protein
MSNLTTYCKDCHDAIHKSGKKAPTAENDKRNFTGDEITWSRFKSGWKGAEWYEKLAGATLLAVSVLVAAVIIGLVTSIPAAVIVVLLGGSPGTSDLNVVWFPLWIGGMLIAIRNFLKT